METWGAYDLRLQFSQYFAHRFAHFHGFIQFRYCAPWFWPTVPIRVCARVCVLMRVCTFVWVYMCLYVCLCLFASLHIILSLFATINVSDWMSYYSTRFREVLTSRNVSLINLHCTLAMHYSLQNCARCLSHHAKNLIPFCPICPSPQLWIVL